MKRFVHNLSFQLFYVKLKADQLNKSFEFLKTKEENIKTKNVLLS